MANRSKYVIQVTEMWNETERNVTLFGSTVAPKAKIPEQIQSTSVETICIVCILCLFSVVGTLGNSLVLYVFTRTAQKLTSTVFIIALACTDFVTCLVIIPYTVVSIYTEYRFPYDAVCKVYQFLITCPVPLSMFIMVAIAVDRYICICHPFAHVMTVPRAKIIVAILMMFASVLGIITALSNSVFQIRMMPPQNETLQMESVLYNISENVSYSHQNNIMQGIYETKTNVELVPTTVFDGLCQASATILSINFIEIYQKVYSSFFLCSLLIVLILYVLIYISVTRQRAKRKNQKKASRVKQVNTQCQTDESTMPLTNMNHKKVKHDATTNSLRVDIEGETVSTRLTTNMAHENGKVEAADKPSGKGASVKRSGTNSADHKDRKDHLRLANIKTAVMLFTVTLVFIVAFLPAWLMAHAWLQFNIVVFYMYFAYNVANPVIYAFMNQMFRDNLCKLVNSCRMYYNGRGS